MNCPKCGEDMQEGFLQTAKIVAFNKTRHKISLNPKDDEDVMIITENGTIIRLNVKDINILGRTTQGVTLMRTNEGKVVSIETISPEEDE